MTLTTAGKTASPIPTHETRQDCLPPPPRQLDLDVHYAVPLIGLPSPEQFSRWVAAALRNGPRLAQIGLRVVDEAEGRELNHGYRGRTPPPMC